jgi:hypothetical protein
MVPYQPPLYTAVPGSPPDPVIRYVQEGLNVLGYGLKTSMGSTALVGNLPSTRRPMRLHVRFFWWKLP